MSKIDLLSSYRLQLKGFFGRIEGGGQQYVLKSLTEPGKDPLKSIDDLHELLSLKSNRAQSALSFLDFLRTNSSTIHTTILENLKSILLQKLEKLSDSTRNVMLKETLQFIAVDDLKVVPFTIIKQMEMVPKQVLHYLIQKKLIMEFPITVRRQAWIADSSYFVKSIDELCFNSRSHANRSFDETKGSLVHEISDMIGGSEYLFAAFADRCSGVNGDSTVESTVEWKALLLTVSVEMHRTRSKSSVTDKFHDVVSLVDRCNRQGRIDASDITLLVNLLRSLITAQSTALEKLRAVANVPSKELLLQGECASSIKTGKRKLHAESEKDESSVQQQRHVKEGLQFLRSLDEQDVFLERVTNDIAPGYSRMVSRPMCRNDMVAKMRSGRYKEGLVALDADVRLMFDNCILYNGTESVYGKLARRLRYKWEAFASKSLGASQPTSSTTSSFDRVLEKIQLAATEIGLGPAERLRRVLHSVLDHMIATDNRRLFFEPVSDRAVPGYSKIVKRKMAFSDIRKSIHSGAYASLNDMSADMVLIFDNCALFNTNNDPILSENIRIRAEWQELLRAVEIAALKPQHIAIREVLSTPLKGQSANVMPLESVGIEGEGSSFVSVASASAAGAKKDENITSQLTGLQSHTPEWRHAAMMLIWDRLTALDRDGLFSAPVHAEGYLSVVRSPIDLGTIKKRVDRGKYRDLGGFVKDVRLLVANCELFNAKGSQECSVARMIIDELESLLAAIASCESSKMPNNDRASNIPNSDMLHAFSPNSAHSVLMPVVASAPFVESSEKLFHSAEREHSQLLAKSNALGSVADMTRADESKNLVVVNRSAPESDCGTTKRLADDQERKDALLHSSQAAVRFIQHQASLRMSTDVNNLSTVSHGLLDLPPVLMESRLLWAITVIRDSGMQSLFVDFLARRLSDRMARSLTFGELQQPLLPHEDSHLRAACQMCQLGTSSAVDSGAAIAPLDEKLWRVVVPHLLMQTEQASTASTISSRPSDFKKAANLMANEVLRSSGEHCENGRYHTFVVSLAFRLLQIAASIKERPPR